MKKYFKGHKFWLLLGFVLIIAIAIFVFLRQGLKSSRVLSWEECIKQKDSVILESYPAVCVTEGGKGERFVQPLSEEEKKGLLPPSEK